MFSIENLAWRTSNKEGFRVSDLPACERGPNGGRVMWFPPYGLTFNEDSRPSFNENTFIGRPEPVYTYKNTSRSGSLSFKIVVDHPSILNLIVNKVLANADRETADNIIDSFFAGCKEYDLYDLAQTYNTIPASDLVYFQTIVNTVTPQNPASQEFAQPINQSQPSPIIPQQTKPSELNWNKYKNLGFYFYNDNPDPNTRLTQTTSAYDNEYQFLISKENTFIEVASRNNFQTEMQNFFDDIVIDNFSTVGDKLIPEIKKVLDDGTAKSITISLIGSASAPATRSYNVDLSKRRIDSVKDYFENKLGSYIQSGSSHSLMSS
jgi:outer membrane protein OmpA-like peptidoglycan-associated protein